MSESDFVAPEPAHNRPVIGGRSEYQVLLPADKADGFSRASEANEKPRDRGWPTAHALGDASKHWRSVSAPLLAAIKSVNGIRSVAAMLAGGYNLLVRSDGPVGGRAGQHPECSVHRFPNACGHAATRSVAVKPIRRHRQRRRYGSVHQHWRREPDGKAERPCRSGALCQRPRRRRGSLPTGAVVHRSSVAARQAVAAPGKRGAVAGSKKVSKRRRLASHRLMHIPKRDPAFLSQRKQLY